MSAAWARHLALGARARAAAGGVSLAPARYAGQGRSAAGGGRAFRPPPLGLLGLWLPWTPLLSSCPQGGGQRRPSLPFLLLVCILEGCISALPRGKARPSPERSLKECGKEAALLSRVKSHQESCGRALDKSVGWQRHLCLLGSKPDCLGGGITSSQSGCVRRLCTCFEL